MRLVLNRARLNGAVVENGNNAVGPRLRALPAFYAECTVYVILNKRTSD